MGFQTPEYCELQWHGEQSRSGQTLTSSNDADLPTLNTSYGVLGCTCLSLQILCLYSECCTALRLLFDCRPFVLDDEALCFEAIFPVLRLVRSCYALNLRAVALTHEQAFATPDLSTLQVATPPWCKLLRTAFDLTDCLPPAACKSSICRSRCG